MSQAQDNPPEDALDARILHAAEALLASAGPDFTMEALARAAGVSRATLYRRVPSREKLAERLRRERDVDTGGTLAREPSRRKILETTRQLVGQLGLMSLTVEQIADAAGVSPVTIYRTFGDKDALLRAVFNELGPRSQTASLFADLDAPVADTLTRFVATVLRWISEQPAFMAMILFSQGEQARYIAHLRKSQEGTFERLTRYLAAQAERGVLRRGDPRDHAQGLMGLTLSFMLERQRPRTRETPEASEDLEARARTLVQLFLHGVAASRPDKDTP